MFSHILEIRVEINPEITKKRNRTEKNTLRHLNISGVFLQKEGNIFKCVCFFARNFPFFLFVSIALELIACFAVVISVMLLYWHIHTADARPIQTDFFYLYSYTRAHPAIQKFHSHSLWSISIYHLSETRLALEFKLNSCKPTRRDRIWKRIIERKNWGEKRTLITYFLEIEAATNKKKLKYKISLDAEENIHWNSANPVQSDSKMDFFFVLRSWEACRTIDCQRGILREIFHRFLPSYSSAFFPASRSSCYFSSASFTASLFSILIIIRSILLALQRTERCWYVNLFRLSSFVRMWLYCTVFVVDLAHYLVSHTHTHSRRVHVMRCDDFAGWFFFISLCSPSVRSVCKHKQFQRNNWIFQVCCREHTHHTLNRQHSSNNLNSFCCVAVFVSPYWINKINKSW